MRMRGAKRSHILEKVASPLSFHKDYQSKFWRKQIETCRSESTADVSWAGPQIRRVVQEHEKVNAQVHLSTKPGSRFPRSCQSSSFSVVGSSIWGYTSQKRYDCPESRFTFSGFPPYPCAVEVKKRSSRFNYQIMRYTDLPRAVVLCPQARFCQSARAYRHPGTAGAWRIIFAPNESRVHSNRAIARSLIPGGEAGRRAALRRASLNASPLDTPLPMSCESMR